VVAPKITIRQRHVKTDGSKLGCGEDGDGHFLLGSWLGKSLMTNELRLQRIFTVDARKDLYDNYYHPPKLKRFCVDEPNDLLFAIMDGVVHSFLISQFPEKPSDLHAVYTEALAVVPQSNTLLVGGDNLSGSPPLKSYDVQMKQFQWALSHLSDKFLGRASGIANGLSRFGATHLESPITSVSDLAAASQGRWFAAAYRDSSNLFNVGKFSLDGMLLDKQECAVTSGLAIAPDDSVIAVASGRTVMLMDASNWTSIEKREVSDSAIGSLTFSGQRWLLAIAEEGEIICLDPLLNTMWHLSIDAIPRCLHFDIHSNCCYVGTNLGDLLIVDLNGQLLEHNRVSESVRGIATIHNGRHVLVGCKNFDFHVFVNQSIELPEYATGWEERLSKKPGTLYTTTSTVNHGRVFISYSSADRPFVQKMEAVLTESGMKCWRDEHELVAGRITKQLKRAIMSNDVVLVVLSKNSLSSDWVEWELASARERERTEDRDVICPIAIDTYWKEWGEDPVLKREVLKYQIVSFENWTTGSIFEESTAKLLKGLKQNYLMEGA
jgi:TIR domain